MRIEQYFLITDYALWEVILNSDSPLPTRSVEGVETPYPPTTVEEKLARKYELKYENFNGTSSEGLDQIYDMLLKLISQHEIYGETISQEDLNLKFLRCLSSGWKTHTLIWRNKPDLETLSMDDLYNNLKIYEAEVMSTNKAVNTAHGVSAASSKTNVSNLPNVDGLSDAVIYSFFAITQCDGLGYDWSDQAKDGPINFALMDYTSSSSLSSSNSNTEFNLGTYKAGLASVEARLKVYKKNELVFEDDIKILKLDVMLRDKAITELRQKLVFEDDIKILKLDVMLRDKAITELRQTFEKPKKRDDLKLALEKFEGSSKNLSILLDSQQSDKSKTVLGYNSQGGDSQVMPDIAKSKVKTSEIKLKNVSAPIIEDWVSDCKDEDEIETKSKQIKPSFAKEKFVKSTKHVKSLRKSVKQEESNRQTKYPRKTSQSPRDLTNPGLKTLNTARHPSSRAAVSVNTDRPINTAYPRLTVNGVKPSSNVFYNSHSPVRRDFNQRTTSQNGDLKEIGNKSFLIDYQKIDGEFVSFGGSPKGERKAAQSLL
nr:hypothetical protein [Tanacetum cinerariifolium]